MSARFIESVSAALTFDTLAVEPLVKPDAMFTPLGPPGVPLTPSLNTIRAPPLGQWPVPGAANATGAAEAGATEARDAGNAAGDADVGDAP